MLHLFVFMVICMSPCSDLSTVFDKRDLTVGMYRILNALNTGAERNKI